MIRGHVERFEVVVVVFDFGAFEHLVPEARKDLDYFIADQAERMTVAELRPAPRQRNVHRVSGTPRRGELLFERGKRGLDFFLQLVGALAERLLLLGRGALERLHERRDPAVTTADPPRAQQL